MKQRVLVTGGAGFIGSHVVDRLLERGYRVRVYDKLVEQVHGTDGPLHLSSEAELIVGDMRDRGKLERALRGVDSIIHLAAEVGVGQSMYEIVRYMEANTTGTAVLLQLLAEGSTQVGRVVVASSMSVYGEGAYECRDHGVVSPLPRPERALLARKWEVRCPHCGATVVAVPTPEDKPLVPTSVYAVSKMDQELLCLSVCEAYKIGAVALRFYNTYGPRQALSNPYTGVGAIFCARLLNHHAPKVFEDGRQLRDFIHVSDVSTAVVKALEKTDVTGEAFNIGTGRPVSVAEVARQIAAAMGRPIEPEITGAYRAGDIRHCWASPRRARARLGFEAEKSFSDGVRDLVEWVAHEIANDNADHARSELEARGLTG